MKDMISWEVLSNQISNNLELWFVQDSLKDLEKYDFKMSFNLFWSMISLYLS